MTFSQTYARYSPTSKTVEIFISRKRIKHNGDQALSWAVGNVVMETDANANIKPNKKKAANKIDPAVAFLMSFGTYLLEYGEVDINLTDAQKQALDEFKGIEL
nr:terminase TerL endonuclease subunit [Gilliamella apicola]